MRMEGRKYNNLRPEAVEAWMYLWRATHDPVYRQWGWEVFQAIQTHCRVDNGFVGLLDASQNPPQQDDLQQSFFLAETLKYLYLLFSPDDVLPLNQWVFNTEAHPLKIISRDLSALLRHIHEFLTNITLLFSIMRHPSHGDRSSHGDRFWRRSCDFSGLREPLVMPTCMPQSPPHPAQLHKWADRTVYAICVALLFGSFFLVHHTTRREADSTGGDSKRIDSIKANSPFFISNSSNTSAEERLQRRVAIASLFYDNANCSSDSSRSITWAPEKDKYLLVTCTHGHVADRLVCLQRYVLVAAMLNRTLVIPEDDLCGDAARHPANHGDTTDVTLPRRTDRMPPFVSSISDFPRAILTDAPRSYRASVLSLGDLRNLNASDLPIGADIPYRVFHQLLLSNLENIEPPTGVRDSCVFPLEPSREVVTLADWYRREYIGGDYAALRLERRDCVSELSRSSAEDSEAALAKSDEVQGTSGVDVGVNGKGYLFESVVDTWRQQVGQKDGQRNETEQSEQEYLPLAEIASLVGDSLESQGIRVLFLSRSGEEDCAVDAALRALLSARGITVMRLQSVIESFNKKPNGAGSGGCKDGDCGRDSNKRSENSSSRSSSKIGRSDDGDDEGEDDEERDDGSTAATPHHLETSADQVQVSNQIHMCSINLISMRLAVYK
ncbi:unnamed protein product [Closterium sp. Yama58-4]|nr:unnamed protein product [Closterium sp. Yama58-4]